MYRDGATTARHFANPGEGRISHHQYGKFQTGMVLSNTISRRILEAGQERNRKIETQLLVFDGLNWDAFTYRWNDDESDANLVAGEGDRRELTVADERLGTKHLTHRFVSRSQCKTCHHVFNQGPITLRPMYLWADDDGGEGNGVYHSWKKLVADGHVEEAGCDPEDRMVAVDESLSSLSDRARSYLEINCRSCHQPAGGATSAIHLARGLSNQQLQVIDQPATQGDFGLLGGKIVVPGHPEQSILMYRLATSGPGSMPKNNHCDPDLAGGRLLWDWITSLESGDEASVAPSPLSDALLDWHRAATRPASDARVLASKRLANSADAVVRGLFEPWLPQNERIVRVGNEPNTVELLAIEGNAERGRIWYTQHAAAQCRNCHHVDKADALIGPSLQGISRKRTRAELLEQILMPSKQIEPQWRSWQVQLASGQVVTGLKISDDAQHWTLKQADGKTTTIAADEIEFSQASAQSLMPDGLLATLTPQEAADLISFLISL
jgi:putative heme-binding domain-containing protein